LSLAVQRRNLKNLLETSGPFRKFIWTILNEAAIFYPTYSRRSPHDTSHAEGRRALGLEVLHMLKHVRPDILSLIEREGNLLEREIEAAAISASEDEYAPQPVPDDDEPDGSQP
jgi:hypothetical protein